MATDLNTVALVGRLTRNVEMRYSANGNAIASISLAVNRRVKAQDGSWQDKASFFDCTYFGKGAEGVSPYLNKGQQVSIQGYLDQQSWEQSGQKRSKVVVIVNSLGLLGSSNQNNQSQPQNHPNQQNRNAGHNSYKPQGTGQAPNSYQSSHTAPNSYQQGGYKPQAPVAPENFESDDFEDEIPF